MTLCKLRKSSKCLAVYAPQAMPQKARVKYRSSLQGTMVVAGNSIPSKGLAGVPPYKSWSYLMQNELANETGGRIFYTDATGGWPLLRHAHCRCFGLTLEGKSASGCMRQARPSRLATVRTRRAMGRACWRARTGSASCGCCSTRHMSWAQEPWSSTRSPGAWGQPTVRLGLPWTHDLLHYRQMILTA